MTFWFMLLVASFLVASPFCALGEIKLHSKLQHKLQHNRVRKDALYIWPQPHQVTSTGDAHFFSANFQVSLRSSSGKIFSSSVVSTSVERFRSRVFQHKASKTSKIFETVNTIDIQVSTTDESLDLETAEDYSLSTSSKGVEIHASNVYGVVYAIETLTQLIEFDYSFKTYVMKSVDITDKPAYKYRSILFDTARHFLPVQHIKQLIDSLVLNKYNVLHWHLVDDQSFPVEIPSLPFLWKGAFSERERLTFEDMEDIVEYGRLRAMKVIPEVDIPGHTKSWCKGMPEVCSNVDYGVLDVSNSKTFETIDTIFNDIIKAFPYGFIHLGGDEVDQSVWSRTPRIQEWLNKHNMSTHDAYLYFVSEAQKLAFNKNLNVINWEELWTYFGSQLDNRTIIQVWLSSAEQNVPKDIAEAGYRVIVSNSLTYLDHLEVTWDSIYKLDLRKDIIKNSELVLGGEVCMWGETVDPSDLLSTVFPRASAFAERLWSNPQYFNLDQVHSRLQWFRCLMNSFGVQAAPLNNARARESPPQPGSCYQQ